MKCLNCIQYCPKTKSCDKGLDKNKCNSYWNMANCLYLCAECPNKWDCDISDRNNMKQEIEKYVRYQYD